MFSEGVVTFADDASIDIQLNDFPSGPVMLKSAIYGLPYVGGKTNIAAALKLTREQFFAVERGHRQGHSTCHDVL